MRKGFTLAELLIALAILGVIATFAVPKVLNAQQQDKRRAVFKETIAAFYNASYTGQLMRELREDNFVEYMFAHINAVKICPTNAVAEGCWTGPSPADCNASWIMTGPGMKLANGAEIGQMDNEIQGQNTEWFAIDWDGGQGANSGDDDLLCTSIYFDGNSSNKPMGTIGPFGVRSTAVWENIFQE